MKKFYLCLLLLPSYYETHAKGSLVIKNYGSNQQQSYGGSSITDQHSFLATSFGKQGNITPFKYGVGVNTQTFNPTTFFDITDIQTYPEDYDDFDQLDSEQNVIIESDYPYADGF